jgi:hypothetical protein
VPVGWDCPETKPANSEAAPEAIRSRGRDYREVEKITAKRDIAPVVAISPAQKKAKAFALAKRLQDYSRKRP